MQKLYFKHKSICVTVLLLLFICIASVFSGIGDKAYAAVSDYSSVKDDLTKDENFDAWDYPENPKDYSINVIQIAESKQGNLFLYTYQPCQKVYKIAATEVNMSLSESADGTQLYELMPINSSGVFCKYIVMGVKVSSAATRYYNLSSIYRVWDNEFDGETGNNNTGEKKAFNVGKVYKVKDENGDKVYSCEPTYVVNILNPYADFLLYSDYHSLPAIPSIKYSYERLGFIDAHYIAFSTDWEIDKLMSATVTYTARPAYGEADKLWFFPANNEITYGKEEVCYAYPEYGDKVEREGDFWNNGIKYSYSWDRIQTVFDFINNEKGLTEETKNNLAGKQWVLRFTETKREQTKRVILGYETRTVDWTQIRKVAVLRLEFETDGRVYNLGTVSDAVSGDNRPGNVEPKPEDLSWWEKVGRFFENIWNSIKNFFKGFKWWQWVLLILGVILGAGLIISLVMYGIKAVFKFIGWLIVQLIKVLWWLLCLPFRGIAALFNNISGKNGGKSKNKSKKK